MHKISVSLGNIDDAIRQFEEYEKNVQQNIKDFLQKLLESGVEIAKAKVIELGAIDSGELLNSLQLDPSKEGNKGIIFTDCSHAVFVEFGTGVAKNGKVGSSPHPKGEELGMRIGEYGEGHGANKNGWWFKNDAGIWVHTLGQGSRPFLYNTATELERRVVEIAKEVFSR